MTMDEEDLIVQNLYKANKVHQKRIKELEGENKRLREILAQEVDDGRADVDDIGVEAWINRALKG